VQVHDRDRKIHQFEEASSLFGEEQDDPSFGSIAPLPGKKHADTSFGSITTFFK